MQTVSKQAGKAKESTGNESANQTHDQTRSFEKGMALFHAREFQQAKDHFAEATAGPNLEMSHAAKLHLKMCEQRLQKQVPAPKTVEEYYNYAIALINRRELEAAQQQLTHALAAMESGDHLHYAMALVRGLLGDFEGARRSLRRAIDLHPRNLAAARNDPDFHEISRQPLLREILFPDRN